MRPVLFLSAFALAACGPTSDKDTDDTDTTVDTDDSTADTDDTDTTVDTDETDEPTVCALSAAPSGTVRTTEPAGGEQITFRRNIEACVSDEEIRGQWVVTVTGGNGDLLCTFVAPFVADTAVTGAACTDCDEAFGGVQWSGISLNPTANCGLFGIENEEPFYGYDEGSAGYTAFGAATGASPDLYHLHLEDGWVQIDDSETDENVTSTRTATAFDVGTLVGVAFETSYNWVD